MNQLPKESIIKLQSHINKEVVIQFQGGRQVKGTLLSFDNLLNLVLDEVRELPSQRILGLVICRGALINSFAIDGMVEIENPYM
ncbi:unnamed protein product (macronuclear) [Paramecium tetraurelia]|uniref:Sm domain-containing protein n=1 Tax=Paramecium tetraurelia TaxID=5888 RepID=A0D3X6_PARTE|nr:uncharacterized protein GSPATT00013208001 [Paramecium tetraurelia]CAK77743.1 unnamed protein product [Paramecium tetraurelia]|eukprot:XP_001445140.1 hypothetical protein (macronuclear) [Paramecium tetraurelia strain d4-2]